MQQQASRSRKKWLLTALLAADLFIFCGTNPANAPSLGLFVGFLLLVVNFYVLLLGGRRLVAWYGVSPGRLSKRFIRLSAGLFGAAVALQSIGGLNGRDLIVLLPLALVAYFYLSYGRTQPASA